MEKRSDIGSLPEWEHLRADKGVTILFFKGGAARCFFRAGAEEKTRGDRGVILDQSAQSRIRAAWTFGCADCTWFALSTLTWRFAPEEGFFLPTPEEVHRAADYVRRKWKARWGEPLCGWIMEMHRSGVPHFHTFHARESAFGEACANAAVETVTRRGKAKRVVRGGPDFWLRSTWLKAIRRDDAESVAFNAGGIIELFDNPQGAGRYVGKEAGKRYQKELPPEYAEKGLGQWWWLNPRWQPRVTSIARAPLEEWPWEHPLSHVYSGEDLEEMLCRCLPGAAAAVDVSAANLKTWESWARMSEEKVEWTSPKEDVMKEYV